jgi:hypothetical protein
MTPLRYAALAAAICLALSLLGCSVGPLASGNSSETTNGVSVSASAGAMEGRTIPAASVGVYETSYNPFKDSGFSHVTVADDSGAFRFSGLANGTYNLIVITRDSLRAECVRRIPVFDDSLFESAVDTLGEPGAVEGTVKTDDGTLVVRAVGFIRGPPFRAMTADSGSLVLPLVPAGNYEIEFWVIEGSGPLAVDAHPVDVTVPPGGTASF